MKVTPLDLRQQVEAWLSGQNGLGSDQPYRFWQPTEEMKTKVRMLSRSVSH